MVLDPGFDKSGALGHLSKYNGLCEISVWGMVRYPRFGLHNINDLTDKNAKKSSRGAVADWLMFDPANQT